MRIVVTCRSLTYAQKAAALLERRGIYAAVTKVPQKLRERGCGYGVRLTRHAREAITLLRSEGLLSGRIYQIEDNGEYREVREYDLS